MIRKIKAWLVKNPLTEDPSDYSAVVDSNGKVNIEEIVGELISEGMEIKRETVIDIVSRFNRKCIDLALSGYNVNTGLVYLHATIRGAFHDTTWDKQQHQLRVSVSQGADLRKAAAETTVEILGEHRDLITLFGITDMSTGRTDGSVRRGFNAEIRGTYIKVIGDDPSVGLYLHGVDSGDEIRLPEEFLVLNEPSRILFLIPNDMPDGRYELHVTTQYSSGNKPMKTPRTAVLSTTVVVE